MKRITERTQFGRILRALRKARKIPVRAIAEATGYSMQTVTNWEIGRFAPDLVTMCKIGDLFQCSIDDLIGRSAAGKRVEKFKTAGKCGRPARTPDIEKLPFGANLRALRKQSGIKQRIVATTCGVSMQTVTNWEIGGSEPANILTFCKLADLFCVSLDDLVGHVTLLEDGTRPWGKPSFSDLFADKEKPCKDCAAKDRLIASQQATIDRLSNMLEALAAPKK